MTPLCRRQLLSTMKQHNDRTASSHDLHRPSTPDTAAVVASTRTRVGRFFQRRHNVTAQLRADSLTSIYHLRAGQYYRWNPDISRIPASQSSVKAKTGLCKSPTDGSVSADSAASSPWQHKAFVCSHGDSSMASHDFVSPRLQPTVSVLTLLWICPSSSSYTITAFLLGFVTPRGPIKTELCIILVISWHVAVFIDPPSMYVGCWRRDERENRSMSATVYSRDTIQWRNGWRHYWICEASARSSVITSWQ